MKNTLYICISALLALVYIVEKITLAVVGVVNRIEYGMTTVIRFTPDYVWFTVILAVLGLGIYTLFAIAYYANLRAENAANVIGVKEERAVIFDRAGATAINYGGERITSERISNHQQPKPLTHAEAAILRRIESRKLIGGGRWE